MDDTGVDEELDNPGDDITVTARHEHTTVHGLPIKQLTQRGLRVATLDERLQLLDLESQTASQRLNCGDAADRMARDDVTWSDPHKALSDLFGLELTLVRKGSQMIGPVVATAIARIGMPHEHDLCWHLRHPARTTSTRVSSVSHYPDDGPNAIGH